MKFTETSPEIPSELIREVNDGCACRKSNSHIQMVKSAKKWHGQNATNGMYCSLCSDN
jgi:hypothetical protein